MMGQKIIVSLLVLGCSLTIHAGPVNDSLHQIHFFKNSQEALHTRFWLLHEAKEEILVSTYIFEDDEIGFTLLHELIEIKKNKPEIVIKVLVDASANRLSENLMYHINKSDIPLMEFHPMPQFWMPISHISPRKFFKAIQNINSRMHDKLMVIDKKYTITGGRNIDQNYFDTDAKNYFLDMDILIKSDSIGKLTSWYFYKLWDSDHVQPLCPAIDYSQDKNYEKDINRFRSVKNYMLNHPDYSSFKKSSLNQQFEFIPLEEAHFLHSFCKNNEEFIPKKLSANFYEILSSAKKTLTIETPYLVCTEEFTKTLRKLLERKVRVIFITNSFCSTDMIVAAAAYDLNKKNLIDMGAEIYEYAGDSYLHAKTALIDDQIGFIGTFNMDPRSANINTENMFMFKGEKAIAELKQKLNLDIKESNKVELVNGKISWENQNCKKKDMDWLLYILIQILSHIPSVYNLL